MDAFISTLSSINWTLFLQAGVLLAVAFLILSFVFRLLFGNRTNLSTALSSALEILFLYALTIGLYSAGARFQRFLSPLPFVTIEGSNLSLFAFSAASHTEICSQILSMVILSFLANVLDRFIPKGEKLFTWLFFRCVTVALAMALHYGVNTLISSLLPEGILLYAPTVLLWLLVVLLCVGALKYLVGIILVTVNPVIAFLYTFFFSTFVGTAITRALLTTAILSLLVYGLSALGISGIPIDPAALIGYIPLLVALAVLWYAVNRIFEEK